MESLQNIFEFIKKKDSKNNELLKQHSHKVAKFIALMTSAYIYTTRYEESIELLQEMDINNFKNEQYYIKTFKNVLRNEYKNIQNTKKFILVTFISFSSHATITHRILFHIQKCMRLYIWEDRFFYTRYWSLF